MNQTQTPPPFTAWVNCPRCGVYECHKMRNPRPAPTAAELEEWGRTVDRTEITAFGRRDAVRVIENPPRPVDESIYEVVRICRCGHEWGMA